MSTKPKVVFSDQFIRNLPTPEQGRVEFSDAKVPGLRVRKSYTGRISWSYEKRVSGGVKRKHKVGEYPGTSLRDARKEARRIGALSDAGVDIVADRKKQQADEKATADGQHPLRFVVSSYYELHAHNLATGNEVMSQLWQALAKLLDRPAFELTNVTLQAAIDAKARTSPIQANRLQAYLSHFAKFGRVRGYFPPEVGRDLQKAIRETPREREPSLSEIRRIYNATFALGDLWGPLFRLLILTAQRKSEIAKLVWPEVVWGEELLNLGGSRTKNGTGHITHLNAPALSELAWLQSFADEDARYVFSTTGDTPVSGFSSAKTRLDNLLGADFEPWRIHDLRTGFATVMAEAGEPEGVIDRILNHAAVGSAPSAVARVYNRAKMLPERKRVLNAWGEMVTGT